MFFGRLVKQVSLDLKTYAKLATTIYTHNNFE